MTEIIHENLWVNLAFGLGQEAEAAFGKRTGSTFSARSNDTQYQADQATESYFAGWFDRVSEQFPQLCSFTEDGGFRIGKQVDPDKDILCVIADPVDGSRPHAAGIRACSATIVGAKMRLSPDVEPPKMKDICYATINTLDSPNVVYHWSESRGIQRFYGFHKDKQYSGSSFRSEKHELTPSSRTELRGAFAAIEDYGLSPRVGAVVMGYLHVNGCYDRFHLISGSKALWKVADGGVDFALDIRDRIVKNIEAGVQATKYLSPMDIAAAAVMAKALGCVVTDAMGLPLDDYPLFTKKGGGSMSAGAISMIAAATPELHAQVLGVVNAGFEQLDQQFG